MACPKLKNLFASLGFVVVSLLFARPVLSAVATLPQNMPNQQLQIFAPTPSLTAIVNNMMMRSKSLSVTFVIAPNLPVTQPVDVRVEYLSIVLGKASERTVSNTQRYDPKAGLVFLWNDSERGSPPRNVRINIWFSERSESGKVVNFGHSYHATLDPLYDVEIGALTYKLIENCDGGLGGSNSETKISVGRPDGSRLEGYETLAAGQSRIYPQFSWVGKEISASRKLRNLDYVFFEDDCHSLPSCLPYIPKLPIDPWTPLIPGKTEQPRRVVVKEFHGDKCTAEFSHHQVYTLRRYDVDLLREIQQALGRRLPAGGKNLESQLSPKALR